MSRFLHGYKGTPMYDSWKNMRQRCNNPNHKDYQYYGGKGITYDPRWDDFNEFLLDMGERPEGMSLDRYPDPNGDYYKENCRWANQSDQVRNSSKFKGKSPTRGVYKQNQGWRSRSNRIDGKITLYTGPDLFEAVCRRRAYELLTE